MDMMELHTILRRAVEQEASDIFLIPGLEMSYKINGTIRCQGGSSMSPQATASVITAIYEQAEGRSMDRLTDSGDDDFSFSVPGLSRFRVNAFKQRNSLAAVVRVVSFQLPDYRGLHIPEEVMAIAHMKKGFVLVTGPAGSGKSTTQACIIDRINRSRSAHIITLEDPIEYLHHHGKSIVTQREIGTDSCSYAAALRASLRQAPDVILLGEMRDAETVKTAITAAETGHLVISTLHTGGAVNTIDRIIDSFPPAQQQQIRVQLSLVLEAVVSQQLLAGVDGSQIPAFEIMYLNNAIRNLIRESKIHQIGTVIQTSGQSQMLSMDASVLQLYREGHISRETALDRSTNPELMERRMGGR